MNGSTNYIGMIFILNISTLYFKNRFVNCKQLIDFNFQLIATFSLFIIFVYLLNCLLFYIELQFDPSRSLFIYHSIFMLLISYRLVYLFKLSKYVEKHFISYFFQFSVTKLLQFVHNFFYIIKTASYYSQVSIFYDIGYIQEMS